MSPIPDDLAGLKDDMIAFIEGHGMRRFHGFIDSEEVPSVMWESGGNPDGWKDFVEIAKASNAPFVIMHTWILERAELDSMMRRMEEGEYTSEEDLEDARWLRAYVGKTGFVQLGWAYQGCIFLCENSTEWYDHYQRLREISQDLRVLPIDDSDSEDEP